MNKNKNGFLIIEVLLAIVVLSMVFVSLFSTLSFLTNKTERSKFDSQAASLMQEGIEQSRTSMLVSWAKYKPGDYVPVFDNNAGSWVLLPDTGETELLQGRFTRKITIEKVCRDILNAGVIVACANNTTDRVDSQSKYVSVKITWKEANMDKEATARLLVFSPKG